MVNGIYTIDAHCHIYPEKIAARAVAGTDNFYGENFAEDSKIQYNNTVRGYQAIVDGTTDILFCAAPSTQQEQYIVKLR